MNLKNELMRKAGWWCTPANMKTLPSVEKELIEKGKVILVANKDTSYEVTYFKATGRIVIEDLTFTGKRSYNQYNQ